MPATKQAADEEVTINWDPSAERYVILLGDEPAGYADVTFVDGNKVRPEQEGQVLNFVSTVVDPAFGGRGLGSQLVTFVMDDANKKGLAVIPTCPFVEAWVAKNPDYPGTVVELRD